MRAGAAPPQAPVEQQGQMTHREILSALSGMLLAMFVAFLSSTVVSNALPTIITDLRGSQSQYTWVVTATLLASTASTPIWGKLADLFSKKLLIQLAIVIFIAGSMLAGLSQSVETLIAWRVLQGLGLGGLQALVQIAMAAMISPRERGRYSGLLGGVMAVATVGGPLLGGLLVDTSWLGWRWCFYVGVPFAAVALVLLQRTLHLPVTKRERAHRLPRRGLPDRRRLRAADLGDPRRRHLRLGVDRDGAVRRRRAVLAIVAFVVTELRATEPIVPLRLFRDRTTTLAIVASIAIGVAMFGSSVFLGQYLQISRGYSPTAAGLLTIPMVAGLLLSSTVSGILITRTGRWKPSWSPARSLVVVGFGLLSTIDHETNMVAARRLPVRARRRHRHDDAEPGARRAEHRRRAATSARPAPRSPSSAASAARSASRCSARCSAAASAPSSPRGWPPSRAARPPPRAPATSAWPTSPTRRRRSGR